MAKKPPLTAKTADRHALYQEAVQCTEADVRFIDRVYRKRYDRAPLTLREDFCGTGLLATEWVKSKAERVAFGVDLDREVLAWGQAHNVDPLGESRGRVLLQRGNVLTPKRPQVDVQVAFNFSWWVFHERSVLLEYFKAARASVRKDGLFMLDIHGGYEATKSLKEKKRRKGFVYQWEQGVFNPIDHRITCYIHFEFKDGSKMRRAFTYDWRWWSVMEARDLLREAGFSSTEVYCEGTEKESQEGNGAFRHVQRCDNDPSFVAYIVAVP